MQRVGDTGPEDEADEHEQRAEGEERPAARARRPALRRRAAAPNTSRAAWKPRSRRRSAPRRRYPSHPMPQRDLFANFARMRREMDQLMGDSWGRTRYVSRRARLLAPSTSLRRRSAARRGQGRPRRGRAARSGSRSRPPAAIVGRRARRPRAASTSRSRSPPAPSAAWSSCRSRSTTPAPPPYEDGVLTIELPLRDPEAHRVPIGRPDGGHATAGDRRAARSTPRVARRAPSCPSRRRCRSCRCAIRSPSRTRSPRWRSARCARSSWSTTRSAATGCW